MIPTTLFVLPKQEGKIKTALKKKRGCQIKTRKSNQSQCAGMLRGEMLLTPSQWRKYNKARDGQVVSLPFKHEHLMQNMKHKGGFLPLLAAALVPLISGVAGGLIEKGIAGSGIHPPKLIWCKRLSGHEPTAFQIDPAPHGAGLYLSPWNGKRSNFKSGTGLYLSPYPHKIGSGLLSKISNELHLPKLKRFASKQIKTILDVL